MGVLTYTQLLPLDNNKVYNRNGLFERKKKYLEKRAKRQESLGAFVSSYGIWYETGLLPLLDP